MMWIGFFSIASAAAVCLSVAAVMIQTNQGRRSWQPIVMLGWVINKSSPEQGVIPERDLNSGGPPAAARFFIRIGRIGDLEGIAEPQAGAQEFLRVDGFAVDARLVVQMRSGRAAGRAEPADLLADPDLADFDLDLRQMAVAGRKPLPWSTSTMLP